MRSQPESSRPPRRSELRERLSRWAGSAVGAKEDEQRGGPVHEPGCGASTPVQPEVDEPKVVWFEVQA